MTALTCLHCGKPLRAYRWRDSTRAIERKQWYGDYGDNGFCSLRCGYGYAIARTRNIRDARIVDREPPKPPRPPKPFKFGGTVVLDRES